MIQKLINSVNGIMVLSENSKELIKDIYRIPNNVEIQKIYHGHYIDCYPNECDFQTSRDVLGIPYEKFVYLTPGAIKPYKGHLELIESFFRVSQPDDVLVIAGGGQQSFIDQLKSIIETHSGPKTGSIKLIPKFIEPEQFQYFFNAANATVLPFNRVLNSGSLLLAMSFGSPVIAPRTGSIPEIAPPEFYFGYTAEETSDKSHLCQALIDAKKSITGFASKQKIRTSIIEFAKTNYNWEQVGMKLSHWYSTLLAKYESN
ncbi:glycosyltransferase [bacterium]|nr:glycosyltransferase [bacterium]